jgi:23S rRNA pseudouridine1911/1915/1917 synthase
MQNIKKEKTFKPKPAQFKELRVKHPALLLDFLRENLKDMSRNNIKTILKHKQVAVDGAPITQFDFSLAPGDLVMVSKTRIADRKTSLPKILFEDDDLIVIDKPSGLLTIASDKEKTETAFRLMTEYVQRYNPHARLYVVHRIDRDTSGILMFCKKEDVRNIMQDKWNDIVSKRGYFAIVDGVPKEETKTIRTWLHQTTTQLMYSRFEPDEEGQEAITHYQIKKALKDHAFLDVQIDTGRKNQIRVHLKELGHPIIGDDKYHALTNPIKRLGLHAYALEFQHPITLKKFKFYAELPTLMKQFVSGLAIGNLQDKPRRRKV